MPQATLEQANASAGRRIAEYPLPQGTLVLTLQGQPPGWVEPVLRSLVQFLMLPPNWDSYQGHAVHPANVWAAWHLLLAIMRDDLPPPSLVPTARGGVQIEWHTRGIDLEIEVADPARFLVSFEDAQTGENWEKEIGEDASALAAWVAKLGPSA